MSEHMQVDAGEPLQGHPSKDGPVASILSSVTPGENTLSVEVSVGALKKAIRTDMADSYPSVHLWCDGDKVAITDHERPIEGATEDTFAAFNQAVIRTDVIVPPTDGQRTLVPRDALLTALDEFAKSDTVEVLLEDDWPVVFNGDETITGVAPKLNQPVQQQVGGRQ